METSTHVYVHLIYVCGFVLTYLLVIFSLYDIWRIMIFQEVSVELNEMISGCTSFMHKDMTFYGDKLDLAEVTFRQKH